MTRIYHGWRDVPTHLMPATALGELEYPRASVGEPVAWVEVAANWRGKKDTIALYDARTCPPTTATARQLAAARRATSTYRTCMDCGARCQRPLPPASVHAPTDLRPLCPACRHIMLLQTEQAKLADARGHAARRAADLLGWDDAAVVQVDLTTPPPTPSGRARPATAARVWAVGLDGAGLVDMTVRLVGPRAHHVPAGAVDRADAAPVIHRALLGRRLIVWRAEDLRHLREAVPHPDLPPATCSYGLVWLGDRWAQPTELGRVAVLQWLAAEWRGQLHPHTRTLVECLPPGTPDRLLLMLQRMAATRDPDQLGSGGEAGEPR